MELDGIYDYLLDLFINFQKKPNINPDNLLSISDDIICSIITEDIKTDISKGAIIYSLLTDNKQVIDSLFQMLTAKKDSDLILFVSDCVVKIAPKNAVSLIVFLIMQGSLLFRRQLLELLGAIASKEDERIRRLFLRFLKYGDQNTVEGAVKGAGKLAHLDLISEVVNCLRKHTSEYIRLACVEVLLSFREDENINNLLAEIAENDIYESVRKKIKGIFN
ncbi:MAG TPA: hypothetical protein HPP56_02615 [Nitrospirae bacterium]|nr:hypothetical protein [Nitrospirota bacterium]